jgi:hypothetical protein
MMVIDVVWHGSVGMQSVDLDLDIQLPLALGVREVV